MSKRSLSRRLSDVAGFSEPSAALEQYPTPPDLAAHIVHRAALQNDVAGRTVIDLGAGTGVLALGAACRDARRVIGIELDIRAIAAARENEHRVDPSTNVNWVHGDATQAPLTPAREVTVLMNPPFGAQRGNEHADRAFLETASDIAAVSYSVHNEGSQSFVESFAADAGGEVTHAFRAEMELDRQFFFHESERTSIQTEVFRIEWPSPESGL